MPLALGAFLFFLASAAFPQATYSGQGTAARVAVTAAGQPTVTTAVADTGDLPYAGGSVTFSSIGVSLAPVATVGASGSETSGAGAASHSETSIVNVSIGVLGNVITATSVASETDAGCPGEALSGSSTIVGLQINGVPVTLTGTGQEIPIEVGGVTVGSLTIDERIVSPRSITVNGLHLRVTDPVSLTETVVVIASSRSGINCGFSPTQNLYSGRGTGVRLNQAEVSFGHVTNLTADTGPLPTTGGMLAVSAAGSNVLSGVLTTGLVQSASSGGIAPSDADSSRSNSAVNNLAINLLSGTARITATVLASNTQCACSVGVPSCSAGTTITNLQVQVGILPPETIVVDGTTDQIFDIAVGLGSIRLTLNGRQSGSAGDITASALRIETSLPGLVRTDIVLANSHSGIVCSTPSAAPAYVAGRVLDHAGRPIARAIVSVTDGNGRTRNVATNTFGRYRIDDLAAGGTYVLSASERRFRFSPRVLTLTDNLDGVDLFAVR